MKGSAYFLPSKRIQAKMSNCQKSECECAHVCVNGNLASLYLCTSWRVYRCQCVIYNCVIGITKRNVVCW